ncbi:MAG: CinA family protein [Lachnospiraceae bacterium]
MEQILQLLAAKKWTITTAESCTGGLIAASLVDISGISEFFMEGYITYSNVAKHRILGVSEDTLRTFGAVSQETAEEMAGCVLTAANADISIISTGIAGPCGGTPDKPVGLVYLACATKKQIFVQRHMFHGDRREIREQAVAKALELVETVLKSQY